MVDEGCGGDGAEVVEGELCGGECRVILKSLLRGCGGELEGRQSCSWL